MRQLRRLEWAAFILVLLFAFAMVAIAAEEKSPGYKYVGSSKSDKYHYPTCVWAQRIKPENLIKFGSVKEALDKGYQPCKVCKVCKPPIIDKEEAK